MAVDKADLYIEEIIDTARPNNICDHWEMLCVTEGEITVTKGTAVYKLTKGNVILFAPDEFHNICKRDFAEYIFIAFKGSGEFLFEVSEKAVNITDKEMQLIENTKLLRNYTENALSIKQAYTMLELFLLLCCEKEGIKPCKDKNAVLFFEAADILIKNIDSNISVSALADELNISLSNLKRLFAKYTNIGVHEYYTFIKIAQAKELLRKGETVTATAELTGFANQAYFSAAFKRTTGITPKEYSGNKRTISNHVKSAPKKKSKQKELPSYLL